MYIFLVQRLTDHDQFFRERKKVVTNIPANRIRATAVAAAVTKPTYVAFDRLRPRSVRFRRELSRTLVERLSNRQVGLAAWQRAALPSQPESHVILITVVRLSIDPFHAGAIIIITVVKLLF